MAKLLAAIDHALNRDPHTAAVLAGRPPQRPADKPTDTNLPF